ncbi:MAG: hypothetical protein K2O04_05875 [Clostridiales bacterium]|nr:hypothetical protein [Clostridiales bacterium]
MKKSFLLVGAMSLVVAGALGALVACGGDDGGDSQAATLGAPESIAYNPDTQRISWGFVDGADAYVISFNGDGEREVHANSVTYVPSGEEFTFTIKAKGDNKNDSAAAKVTFVELASDITLAVDNTGKVTWNNVDGADGYQVVIDGVNSFDVVSAQYDEITPGIAHSVRVRPVRSGGGGVQYYARLSDPITVNKLGTPAVDSVKYEDGVITWGAVASASSYKVTVNGADSDVTTNRLEYDAKKQSFNVKITAIGNHTSTYDGQTSEQKSFVYLPAVTDVAVENGILIWEKSTGASAYKLRLNDNAVSTVTAESESYSGLASGTQYNVSIMPTATGENTEYFSEWTAALPVYILPAPQPRWTAGFDANGVDEVNAINWDAVSSATGYSSRVTLPNGHTDEKSHGANNNYYSDAFNTVGEYKVEVKALSNGAAGIYDSKYSAPVIVKRLAAPTIESSNIKSDAKNLDAGFTVAFDGVSGASGYAIYRDGTREGSSTMPSFAVARPVDADVLRETAIAYYVQSLGSVSADGHNVVLNSMQGAASAASAFNITVLAAPTDPTMSGYGYSFTGSDKADGYGIRVSGTTYESSVDSYDLNMLAAGTYTVAACAKGNGNTVLASNYCTPLTVTRLNAPFDLRITTDESDGVLQYEGDPKAQSYEAVITGRSEALTVDSTTNIKQYITTAATVVTMRSVGNYFEDAQRTVYIMTSQPSINYTFFKLEAPSNINFSDSAMSWNGPSNLNAAAAFTPTYKIFNAANNVLYNGEFSGTSYSLNTISGGASYAFDIQAIGDGEHYVNSDVAHSREIYKLATPEFNINASEKRYEWRAVAQASGYVLSIDNVAVSNVEHETGELYAFAPTYTTLGNHSVVLYATGDGGNTTVNSSAYEFTQSVKQLSTPVFAYSYSHDSYNVNGTIRVDITTPSDYAVGYNYVIGGASHIDGESTYSFTPNTTGKIDMYVYAVGGGFDSDNVYYSDSRAAATVSLYLLGYPSADTIDLLQDGVLTWSRVDNAVGYGYTLEIELNDGTKQTVTGSIDNNTARLDLNTVSLGDGTKLIYSDVRTIKVTLFAKGSLSANTPATSNGSVSSVTVEKSWTSALH